MPTTPSQDLKKRRNLAGLEKFKIEAAIRCSFFKNRGSVQHIVDDTGYPVDVVRKLVAKIKKKQRHDVSFDVATNISMMVFEGREQRIERRHNLLAIIEAEAKQTISHCCGAPLKDFDWGGETKITCGTCGKECHPRGNRIDLKSFRALLNDLAKEDELLAVFAEKMGYTFKEAVPIIKEKHYHDHHGSGDQSPGRKKVSSEEVPLDQDEDQQILEQAGTLDPRTREALRKELEKKMLGTGEEKKEEDGKEG